MRLARQSAFHLVAEAGVHHIGHRPIRRVSSSYDNTVSLENRTREGECLAIVQKSKDRDRHDVLAVSPGCFGGLAVFAAFLRGSDRSTSKRLRS
jgi:hypothetical protein